MALSYIISAQGKRQAVPAKPMEPLSTVIAQAIEIMKLDTDAGSCKLMHNGKQLDPSTPVRFANLPRDAKLELITGQAKQQLGLRDKLNTSTQPPEEPPAASQSTAAAAVPHQPEQAGPATQSQPAKGLSSMLGRGADAGNSSSNRGPLLPEVPAEQRALGLGRAVHLFSREAALAAESQRWLISMKGCRASGDVAEPSPEFFEFTPDDYHKVMAGWARQHAKQGAPLKTKKLRDQEALAKAQAMGPLPIRVHFPDGLILQAAFAARDPVAKLKDLVGKCLACEEAPKSWYLYTAPPKQVLKDLSQSLYQAELAPAANVYFGADETAPTGGQVLKPEVLALLGEPPGRSTDAQQAQQGSAGGQGAASQGRAAPHASDAKLSAADNGKKVPKWFKK